MQIAYGDDEVHRVRTALSGTVDIILKRPHKGAAFGGKAGIGDQPDRRTFALGRSGRAGFDDVDADFRKERCNL